MKTEKIFETFSGEEFLEDEHSCQFSQVMQENNLFAMIASRTIGDFSSLEQHRIIYEALVDLSA